MNDLTTLSNNLPAHLRATDDQFAEFQTGLTGGLDIAFLSIRGKEFRFRYQGNETSTRSRQLDVVVVASRPNVSKRWFGKQQPDGSWVTASYEAGSTDMPACFSLDGFKPSDRSLAKQSERCSTCLRNEFGSKISPSGKELKECGDYKRFIVLPVLDGQVTDTPCVMDLSFTSLKKKKGEERLALMFWQEYGEALYRHKIAPFHIVTRMEFTDDEYPRVCFAYDRPLTEDEVKLALTARDNEIVQAALSEEQVEPVGPITEQAPEPEPEPPKSASSDVANLLQGKSKPVPEPEAPKQEAKPEPEKTEVPDRGDLMDQIRDSLKKMGG